jgi:hypothetical protein
MQLPMMLGSDWSRPKRLRVLDDYGYVGGGVSGARHVLAENHVEYIVKGSLLSPQEPYVAVNELLSALLGQALGLPVLDFALVEMNGQTLFASNWMQAGSFDSCISETTFAQCGNRDRVYDIAVFDTLICNEDRHAQNLIVRRNRRSGQPDRLAMVLNDHSRALIPPNMTPSTLSAWLGATPDRFVKLDFIRQSIAQFAPLEAAIEAIEQISEDQMRSLVRIISSDVLDPGDLFAVEQFLLERRAELRTVFNAAAPAFLALHGVKL